MSSPNKNLGIGLAAVGLTIAFFFPYDKITKVQEPGAVPAKRAARQAKADAGQTALTPEPLQGAIAIQRKRDEYNSLIVNRLKEIKTSEQGDRLTITMRTRAEAKGCRSGDFDIIKSLVNDGSDKVFLLSVETLKGKGARPSNTRMNLFDILKGDTHEFTIPKLEAAQEYGVYLCLDPDRQNSCNQKPALATKDWNNALGRAKLPSKTLYFQLITAKASKAYLIPVDKWGSAAITDMKKTLKPWLSKPNETLEQTALLMSKLGSLPAEVNDGNLEIPLPYRDPRCDSKASIRPQTKAKTGGG